jgi:hypothetical protein
MWIELTEHNSMLAAAAPGGSLAANSLERRSDEGAEWHHRHRHDRDYSLERRSDEGPEAEKLAVRSPQWHHRHYHHHDPNLVVAPAPIPPPV